MTVPSKEEEGEDENGGADEGFPSRLPPYDTCSNHHNAAADGDDDGAAPASGKKHPHRRRTASAPGGMMIGELPRRPPRRPRGSVMEAGRLSTTNLNFGLPSNEAAQEHACCEHGEDSWRYKLLTKLHSKPVQMTLVGLLLLDVLILFTELALLASYPACFLVVRDAISCCPLPDGGEVEAAADAAGHRFLAEDGSHSEEDHLTCSDPSLYPFEEYGATCDPHKWHRVHTAELVLFCFTMTILSLMMLELLLAAAALTPCIFFRQVFYAADFIIIAVSLALEGSFHYMGQNTAQTVSGILIFIRMWRFVRIGHGIVEVTHEIAHESYQQLLAYTEGATRKERTVQVRALLFRRRPN